MMKVKRNNTETMLYVSNPEARRQQRSFLRINNYLKNIFLLRQNKIICVTNILT